MGKSRCEKGKYCRVGRSQVPKCRKHNQLDLQCRSLDRLVVKENCEFIGLSFPGKGQKGSEWSRMEFSGLYNFPA